MAASFANDSGAIMAYQMQVVNGPIVFRVGDSFFLNVFWDPRMVVYV